MIMIGNRTFSTVACQCKTLLCCHEAYIQEAYQNESAICIEILSSSDSVPLVHGIKTNFLLGGNPGGE